jgi:hypothetical protein
METQNFSSSKLITPSEVVDASSTSISNQLELFWGKDPTIIISVIQLMQFGYAILLSYVFVYWSLIKRANWGPYGMISVFLFCVSIFFFIMTRIVPRFILCTNIGQLVDKVKLRELLAKHRLEEAIQKKWKINAEKQTTFLQLARPKNAEELIDEQTKNYSGLTDLTAEPQRKLPLNLTHDERMTMASEGEIIPESPEFTSMNVVPPIDSLVTKNSHVEKASYDQECDRSRKGSSLRMRQRKKSASEGVSNMLQTEADNISLVKSSSVVVLSSDGEPEKLKREEDASIALVDTKRVRSRNRKSISEGVAAMRLDAIRLSSLKEAEAVCEEAHFGKLAELVSMRTKDLPKIRSVSELSNVVEDATDDSDYILAIEVPKVASRSLSRKKRIKSLSEGVAFMRSSTALEGPVHIGSSEEPFKINDGKATLHASLSLKSAIQVAAEGAKPEISVHDMVRQHSGKLQSSYVIERQRRKSASAGVDEMRSLEPGMFQYGASVGVGAAAMRASTKDEDAECEEARLGTIADLVATKEFNLPQIRSLPESSVIEDTTAIDPRADDDREDLLVKILTNSNFVEQNASRSTSINPLGEMITTDVDHEQSSEGNPFELLESHSKLDDSPKNGVLLLKHIRSFFSSKAFKTIDVFGTMSCFFVVAMRMNSFLIASHKVDGKFVFTPSAENLFWVEVGFNSCLSIFQLVNYITL